MTHDDIETIEASLGVTLPSEYIDAATTGDFSDPIHDQPRHIVGINSHPVAVHVFVIAADNTDKLGLGLDIAQVHISKMLILVALGALANFGVKFQVVSGLFQLPVW